MTPAERASFVKALSLDERAAFVAEIEAANLSDAVAEALARLAPAEVHASDTHTLANVMNPEDAAAYCGIGINAMRDLLRAGAISHRREGRRYLVRREALDAWMRDEEQAERGRGLRLMERTG